MERWLAGLHGVDAFSLALDLDLVVRFRANKLMTLQVDDNQQPHSQTLNRAQTRII